MSGTPWWRSLCMPTKRRATRPPDLSLAVQSATPADQLPRWRLRAWVMHALRGIAQSGGPDAETLRAVVLTLRLVDADEGQRLNREFRGKASPTTVLTFAYATYPDGPASGDVVLCVAVFNRESAAPATLMLNQPDHPPGH